MKIKIILCFMLFLLLGADANAASFQTWLKVFRQEAIADGIEPDFFDVIFSGIVPNPRVVSFDKTQPEHRISFEAYRKSRADNYRIQLGQKKFSANQTLLTEVGAHYQVDPCFIVSLWGMESSYGHFVGDFYVIKSLATLAFEGRRGDFFRNELLEALHILQEGHVQPEQFVGEWAGASGQPQFLPSSWKKYAVDYDGDGRKDIWQSKPDIFASIANYLVLNGWKANEPWAVPVRVPSSVDDSLIGLEQTLPLSVWQSKGVVAEAPYQLPSKDLDASIVRPDGGPDLMVFNNFRVIMRYNNSIYYAGAIGYMADKICSRSIYAVN